jgi:hypothetical protein
MPPAVQNLLAAVAPPVGTHLSARRRVQGIEEVVVGHERSVAGLGVINPAAKQWKPTRPIFPRSVVRLHGARRGDLNLRLVRLLVCALRLL